MKTPCGPIYAGRFMRKSGGSRWEGFLCAAGRAYERFDDPPSDSSSFPKASGQIANLQHFVSDAIGKSGLGHSGRIFRFLLLCQRFGGFSGGGDHFVNQELGQGGAGA